MCCHCWQHLLLAFSKTMSEIVQSLLDDNFDWTFIPVYLS